MIQSFPIKNLVKKAVYSKLYNLRPADRLIEPIFETAITKHHSIYLGIDQNGEEWIAENHKFKGVQLVRAIDFFSKEKSFRKESFQGNYLQREVAVKRALTALGQPYNLISYNCEHYASYVQTGNAESKQLDNVIDGLKAFAFAAFVIGFFNLVIND